MVIVARTLEVPILLNFQSKFCTVTNYKDTGEWIKVKIIINNNKSVEMTSIRP